MDKYIDHKYPGSRYEILHSFEVLYAGWEMDYHAYIISIDKKKPIVLMTNHGSFYESSIDELKDKVALYKQTIDDTVKGMILLGGMV